MERTIGDLVTTAWLGKHENLVRLINLMYVRLDLSDETRSYPLESSTYWHKYPSSFTFVHINDFSFSRDRKYLSHSVLIIVGESIDRIHLFIIS